MSAPLGQVEREVEKIGELSNFLTQVPLGHWGGMCNNTLHVCATTYVWFVWCIMYVSVCMQSDVCSACVCGYMRVVCMWTVYMCSLFRVCDLHVVCD